MKPSARVLIVGIFIELCLASLAAYLLFQLRTGGMTAATTPQDAVSTITTVLGGAMGLLGGLIVVIFFILRRRGK